MLVQVMCLSGASGGASVGLAIAGLMLAGLGYALGIRRGQRSLLCRAHGQACTRCGECG